MGPNDVKDTLVLSKLPCLTVLFNLCGVFWPMKVKIVIELVLKLNKSRFVGWKLQFKIAVAKFLEI
jgi:hypothetical protein